MGQCYTTADWYQIPKIWKLLAVDDRPWQLTKQKSSEFEWTWWHMYGLSSLIKEIRNDYLLSWFCFEQWPRNKFKKILASDKRWGSQKSINSNLSTGTATPKIVPFALWLLELFERSFVFKMSETNARNGTGQQIRYEVTQMRSNKKVVDLRGHISWF